MEIRKNRDFVLTSLHIFVTQYPFYDAWKQARSSGGERHPDTVDVQGSNPCVPTINFFATKGIRRRQIVDALSLI
jgi:hypothetical protein